MIGKRVVFRLGAIVLGVIPFILLEVGLRVFDVGEPDRVVDPLVGFSQVHSLFEPDPSNGVYRTSRSRQILFGVQEFAAEKPSNGFRVFCLGGSTVRGRPYHVETAFPKWLELELAACGPSREFEVVNCGGLSYASYRLRLVLDEVLRYQPDLIVLATGHNEFLEDRTYTAQKARWGVWAWIEDRAATLEIVGAARRAWGSSRDVGKTVLDDEVNARLDHESGYGSYHRDDAWRKDVIRHFELTLKSMARMCEDASVPLILVNLGSNLRDTAPFKSEHSPNLSDTDQLAWQRHFDAGDQVDREHPALALEHYQAAEAINDEFALLSFRIARCLDRLEQFESAHEYYVKAKNDDICPLRVLDELSAIVKQTAEASNVPLVDVQRLFQQASADRIPGFDWYVDHVHPTIRGHQEIARAVARQIRGGNQADGLAEWTEQQRRAVARQHLDQLGPGYLTNGRRRVEWGENWSRRERLFDETLPVDARGYLHRGFRCLGFGETEAAWSDFDEALRLDRDYAGKILEHGLALLEQGRPAAAEQLLSRLQEKEMAKDLRLRIQFARFILAIEYDDRNLAGELFRSHHAEFEALKTGPWFRAMPDALARGEQLAQ